MKTITESQYNLIKNKSHIDLYARPVEKWAYKIRKTEENASYVPTWYKCPNCGIEFQDTPPTYNIDGNLSQLCPDCGGNFTPMPKGYGISPDGFTLSLDSIKKLSACGCYDKQKEYHPIFNIRVLIATIFCVVIGSVLFKMGF